VGLQNEIVYHRKGLSSLYYVFAVVFVAFGVLFLLIALGNASEPGPWRDKWFNVAGFTVAGLSWICGLPSMWSNAKAYARNQARLDDLGFALHSVGGKNLHFLLPTSVAYRGTRASRPVSAPSKPARRYTSSTQPVVRAPATSRNSSRCGQASRCRLLSPDSRRYAIDRPTGRWATSRLVGSR